MAMTPDDFTSPAHVEAGQARLRSAATALRDHTDDRWVEVSDDMLAGLMSVSRPSHPIRARAASGDFHVSEQVLVASLQREIDAVPHCEVTHIQIQADGDTCKGLTIIIAAQFPHPIIPIADQIREAALYRLSHILGPVTPEVTVSAMHVHVGDVTPGDPKLG